MHTTDIFQGASYLVKTDDNKINAKKFNVNLPKIFCDCHHYQQPGCPCPHAIVLLCRHLQIPIKKEYFSNFCFVDKLKGIFKNCCFTDNDGLYSNLFATVLPSEDSISKILQSNYKDNERFAVLEGLPSKDLSLASSKRIKSQGEHRTAKGIKKITKRIQCPFCKKIISKIRTKHKASAYKSYSRKMNNGVAPLITAIVLNLVSVISLQYFLKLRETTYILAFAMVLRPISSLFTRKM